MVNTAHDASVIKKESTASFQFLKIEKGDTLSDESVSVSHVAHSAHDPGYMEPSSHDIKTSPVRITSGSFIRQNTADNKAGKCKASEDKLSRSNSDKTPEFNAAKRGFS